MTTLKPGTTYAAILGRVLAHYREQAGLEQKEIADKLGLGQSAWSRIERGESIINVEQLRIIADALDLSTSRIMQETDEAAKALVERDVQIQSAKSLKMGNDAIVLIGLAALTALVLANISKK